MSGRVLSSDKADGDDDDEPLLSADPEAWRHQGSHDPLLQPHIHAAVRSVSQRQSGSHQPHIIPANIPQTPSDSEGEDSLPIEQGDYQVYRWRWFILIVVTLLNLSNGMLWLTFSPIADFTKAYYNITLMQVNWLSLVFMVVSVPLGFAASWLLDTCGLRSGILLSAWLNLIGSVVRLVSGLNIPQHHKFEVVLIGQTVAACAQPFVMFATTKMAALWFAGNQRATANMIASIANPLGIMLASLLSPLLVGKHEHNIPNVIYYYTIIPALAALLATFGVCSSSPPSPPSASAGEVSQPFLQGVLKILRTKSYWILLLCFGCGIALFTTLSTLLEQMFKEKQYSDLFAGTCGALLFGVGVLGAFLASVYVDITKKFEEVAKVAFALSTVCLIGFMLAAQHSHLEALIAILISLVGFFGFALYPLCLELSVECTFPVAEATSSGFLIISGQVQSIIYVMAMQFLSGGKDGSALHGYTVANLVLAGIAVLASISFICFFKCPYVRLQTEQQIAADRILNFNSRTRNRRPVNI